MNVRAIVLCMSFVLIFSMLLQRTAHANDDWQLWHTETVRLLTQDKYAMSLWSTARYRDDMNEVYFVMGKVINRYQLHPHLAVAANYGYVQSKGSDNHWREEHRPEVEFYPQIMLGSLTLENRMRVELRMIEGAAGEEDWRYRNRLQAAYAVPHTDGKWQLFASEELFYATPPDQWNQNRVFVGARFKPNKQFMQSIAWGIQSLRRGGDWDDHQVVSAALTFAF